MHNERDGEQNAVGLIDLVQTLLRRKNIIWSCMAGCFTLALIYSLVATKQYSAVLVALPVMEEESGASSKLGGFASLLGAGTGKTNKSQFSVETLKSRDFSGKIIKKHELMKELFADRWDNDKQEWILDDYGKSPSLNAAITVFQKKNLSIDIDQKLGTVTLEVVWFDAKKAAVIANDFVDMLNEFLREKAIKDSKASMEYLKKQIAETKEIEVQEMLYGLVQKELQTAKVAESKHDYAFEVIDPAVPADFAAKPKKKLILVMGLIAGIFLGLLIAFFLDYIWPSILQAKKTLNKGRA